MRRTLKPVFPPAAIEREYKKRLEKAVREMEKSVVYWLRAKYRANESKIVGDSATDDLLKAFRKLLQLNTRGAVDDALSFEFVPLSDEDSDLKARCNKTIADTYATLIDRGVISSSEARLALANNPESGFANIDADEEIDLPEMALPLEGGENA